MTKISRLEIFGWSLFDFANSAYTTIIVTVVYSVFFVNVMAGGHPHAAFLWGLAIFTAESLVVTMAPVVGAIADVTSKKRVLFITFLACVVGTACLGLVTPGHIGLAWFGFVGSNVAYSLGENVNSSFLPELSTPETVGRVSGFAWGVGYLGGLLSLLLCIPWVKYGITMEHEAEVRMTAWVTAGFFLAGGIPMFLLVRERSRGHSRWTVAGAVRAGVDRVKTTLSHLSQHRALLKFFPVYFSYTAGLSIVIAFSSVFAGRQLGFGGEELVKLFMVLQLSACVGAMAFGWLQDRVGARRVLLISMWIWLVVVAGAATTRSKPVFWGVANLAGLVIGATASSSRAYVALLAPPDRSGETYGFMGLFAKLASGAGALAFGTAVWALKSERRAMLVPLLFFLTGLVGVWQLKEVQSNRRAAVDSAGSEDDC